MPTINTPALTVLAVCFVTCASTDVANVAWASTLITITAANETPDEAAAPTADVVTVIVPADEGRIDLADLAASVSTAADLDPNAAAALLPSGPSLNLNDHSTRWLLQTLAMTTRGSVRPKVVRDAAGHAEKLELQIDRARIRRTVNRGKAVTQSAVATLLDDEDESAFGLTWCEPPRELKPNSPQVVLIHGYTGGVEHLTEFTQVLTEAGYHCGQFLYPNDAAISGSVERLATALREHQDEHPDHRLALLTHSMGGLIARAVLEGDTPPTNVSQLIMVAPPNHGSSLAAIPGGLDVYEHLIQGHELNPLTFTRLATADGMNEARQDLKPGSEFLRRLNERPRNPHVAYSIILGDAAPLSEESVAALQQTVDLVSARSRTARLVRPRIDAILESPDELITGHGDGIVSIASGRLDGVDDITVLPFTHGSFKRAASGDDGQTIAALVLERLETK